MAVWKPNGEKCPLSKIDENGNGLVVSYNEAGSKDYRKTFNEWEVIRAQEFEN